MSEKPEETRSGQLLEPARIEPQTEKMQADAGTKLFVTFFFLVVPPLGFVIHAAVCWNLYTVWFAA